MRIVFRTEGNHRQGMGDLIGSMALAEACRPGEEPLFLLADATLAAPLLSARGFHWVEAAIPEEELKALATFHPDVIVVNKLSSPPEYIRHLRTLAGEVVTLEDTGPGARESSLRVNVLYPIPDSIQDPACIPLRKEFQRAHEVQRALREPLEDLLLLQGGSDTYGFTPRILAALEGCAGSARLTLVLGPAFRHEAELKAALSQLRRPVRLLRGISDMPRLMLESDLAISAGGLTLFELACTGTPSIAVCGERFEEETACRVEAAGATVNLGFAADLDPARLAGTVEGLARHPEKRRRMSEAGRGWVDGKGAERVMQLVRERLALAEGPRR